MSAGRWSPAGSLRQRRAAPASMGAEGSAWLLRDQTTFRWGDPRRRSSFRITRARGQPWVLDRSETSKAVGSSLFPDPIADDPDL